MTHGSLFSGIGGFDLAAEWMGWDNKFHCEWNPFGQQVLKYHYPNAESFSDIKKTDFTKYANKIDVLTGGFPCQPYSLAGKRKGKEDERHLWPEMLRAIREIQPRWVVGENVLGIVSWGGGLVFHEVQTDLEAEGYEVWPYVLPAAAVNAPHRRDRVWFIAHLTNSNNKSEWSNSDNRKWQSCKQEQNDWNEIRNNTSSICSNRDATDSNCNGQHRSNSEHEIDTSEGRFDAQCDIEQIYVKKSISEYPNGIGQERRMHKNKPETSIREQFSERDAWSIRPTNWENFPTQSPICGGDDGIPAELHGITFSKWRNESIKAYGNAIVPQVALEIFKAIQKYENL